MLPSVPPSHGLPLTRPVSLVFPADLVGLGAELGPGHQVSVRREPVHVYAGSTLLSLLGLLDRRDITKLFERRAAALRNAESGFRLPALLPAQAPDRGAERGDGAGERAQLGCLGGSGAPR